MTDWFYEYTIMNPLSWTARMEMARAIQENDYKALEKLLDDGVDVDAEVMTSKTPLVLSIECNSLECAQILMDRGCSLNIHSKFGTTPLHAAVHYLNYEFVNLFLANRIDLETLDDQGKTVLHIAAEMNNLRMVETLIAKARPGFIHIKDNDGRTAFSYACSNGNEALVSYFITKGCDVNLEHGYYRNTPLLDSLSSMHCCIGKVERLLDAGANVNYVSQCRETPLLKAFNNFGCGKNSKSIDTSFRDMCSLLIDRGAEVNVQNVLGDTPLHYAVVLNNDYLVHKLLNAGSDVNVPNSLGYTPVYYAIRHKFGSVLTLLLNSGAIIHLDELCGDEKAILTAYFQYTKKFPRLRDLCRLIVRKHLHKSIDKSALQLPLPVPLIKFIQLVE